MVKPKKKCCRCGILYRTCNMQIRDDGVVCKKCVKKERRDKGKMISKTNYTIVPKNIRENLVKENPRLKKIIKDETNIKPKLKSLIKERYTPIGRMFLTMVEKQVLYGKYRKQGYTHSEAGKKVKERINFLKNEMSKLRAKGNTSEEDMNIIFKEKFAQMCEQV